MTGAGGRLKIAVLASGRGSNFIAVHDAIRRGEIDGEIVLLLCNKPGAGAIDAAAERGIDVELYPSRGVPSGEYDGRVAEILRERKVGLVLLAGFMRIVGPRLIEAFPSRIMNIHPALLPAFPGLDAQRQALEYGAKVAGCTVHFVDEGVDTGPVILQKSVPVLEDDTAESLSARILAEEHRLYPEAVRLFALGRLRVAGRRVLIDRG